MKMWFTIDESLKAEMQEEITLASKHHPAGLLKEKRQSHNDPASREVRRKFGIDTIKVEFK